VESSLRAYDRVADRVRLHRQVDNRSTVVVEGPSDRRLIEDLIPKDAVVVFIGGTRDEVLRAASDFATLQLEHVACLVDRDFDDAVADAQAAGHPVVAYDGADLEDMLAHSPALIRMLGELASEEKLAAYGGPDALLAAARDRGWLIARIRRTNAHRGWALEFDAVDFSSKINRDTLDLNVTAMCMALRGTSEEPVSQAELEEAAREGDSGTCPRTARRLVRGRDLLVVVGVALRKVVGSRTKAQAAPDLLGEVLRSSADREWLKRSEWFAELVQVASIPV
jgi:hypothetical protein